MPFPWLFQETKMCVLSLPCWILSSPLNLITFKSTSPFPAFSLNSRVIYLTDFLTSSQEYFIRISNLTTATTKFLIIFPCYLFPRAPSAGSWTPPFMPLLEAKSSLIFGSLLTYSSSIQSIHQQILSALPSKHVRIQSHL